MEALTTIATVRRVLRRELGRIWPIFLLGSLVRRRAIITRTRWATPAVHSAEARYARRLALASAVYLSLSARIGQPRAYAAMRQLLLPIGLAEPRKVLANMGRLSEHGMARLMTFQRRMQQSDGGRFNGGCITPPTRQPVTIRSHAAWCTRCLRPPGRPS